MRTILAAIFIVCMALQGISQSIENANTTNAVGTLPGSLSVSPSGAAVYTIPIELPEGRAGMTPELALTYNSQGQDGILGKAWGLQGWSFINRVAETEYYDGKIGSIDFTDDGFSLDGNRLLMINQDDKEYRTEIDGNTKIFFADSKEMETSESYWIVKTKDGITKYYGQTSQSRQNNGPNTLSIRWHLNKIEDMEGNYIEYEYLKTEATGEIYLEKIIYSKNKNTESANNQYYTVLFTYFPIPDSRNTLTSFFSKGSEQYKFEVKKRLYKIEIKYGINILKTYQLTYNTNDDYYFFQNLKSITLTSGGEQFNSTEFNWSTPGISGSDFYYSSLVNPNLDQEFVPWGIGCDLNGDGITDIVECYDGYTGIWINDGINPSTCISITGFTGGLKAGDFDGDGKDELLIDKTYDQGHIIKFYKYVNNLMLLQGIIDENISFVGDFNGDGLSDLITWKDGVHYFRSGQTTITDFFSSQNKKILTGITHNNYRLANCVGSPKTGILGIENNLLTHYFVEKLSDNTYQAKSTFAYVLPTGIDKLEVGDFNGDGKDDIILTGSGTQICYSNGNGFTAPINMPIESPYNEWWKNNFMISDFNYDGISDIIVIERTPTLFLVNYYYLLKPKGVNTSFNILNSEIFVPGYIPAINYLTYGNFEGKGTSNIYFSLSKYMNGFKGVEGVYTKQNNIGNLITKITNGFGAVQNIEYSFYKRNISQPVSITFPVMVNKFSFPVVKTISKPEGNVDVNLLNYTFDNLLVHCKGKGTLGFSKITIIDYINQVRTITKNSLLIEQDKYFYPYISESKTYDFKTESILLSESFNNVQPFQTQSAINPKIFIPITTRSYSREWDLDGTYKGIKVFSQLLSDLDPYGNSTLNKIKMSETSTDPNGYNWNWEIQNFTEYNDPNAFTNWFMVPKYIITKKYSASAVGWKQERMDYQYFTNGLLQYSKYSPELLLSSPLALKTEYVYDIYGNLTKKIINAPNDINLPSRITEYYYENTPEAPYEGRFLTKKIVKGPADYVTIYRYNPSMGLLINETNILGKITSYSYDAFGRLTETTNPDGTKAINSMLWSSGQNDSPSNSVYYSYTCKNIPALNQNWGESKVFYDKFGRELRTVIKNLQNQKVIIDKGYSIYGNRLLFTFEPYFENTPADQGTDFYYDDLGRIKEIDKYDGSATTYTYTGLKTRTTNSSVGVWSEKTMNAMGKLAKSEDPAGTVTYTYDGNGNLVNTNALGSITNMQYDEAGNLIKRIDPNAGTINYVYNAFGEITSQTDARGNQYKMTYDNLGRLITKTLQGNNEITTYKYNDIPYQAGFGQLDYVTLTNGPTLSYTYDSFGRIVSKTETIDQIPFTFAYKYNPTTGMLENYKFPSAFEVNYLYNARGNMYEIRDAASNNMLWQASTENQRGQLTLFNLGNGLTTARMFDDFGFPTQILSVFDISGVEREVQNQQYKFDPVTGNLLTKKEHKGNNVYLTETYGYDNLLKDRLVSWQVSGAVKYTIDYQNNGNIIKKNDVHNPSGSYSYGSGAGPHAVTGINLPTTEYLSNAKNQDITYTAFNKVKQITEPFYAPSVDRHRLKFTYGPDEARRKMQYYYVGTQGVEILRETKYYLGDYEEKINASGEKSRLHYLSAGNGLFAIIEIKNNVTTPYYVLTDYQGNYHVITDSKGNKLETLSFDPWGRRRNPTNWSFNNVPTSFIFDRGYTGHEHLNKFGLINMNGRVYGPFIARFLSPDPIIQSPSYTQNYNRYSYAFNNPLKYTDPSGLEGVPVMIPQIPDYSQVFAAVNSMNVNCTQYNVSYITNSNNYMISSGGSYNLNSSYVTSGNAYHFGLSGNAQINYGTQSYSYEEGLYINRGSRTWFDASLKMQVNAQYGPLNYSIDYNSYYSNSSQNSYSVPNTSKIISQYNNLIENVNNFIKYTNAVVQEGITGFSENNFIKYSVEGTSVWAGTVQTGFDAARKLQPAVSTWINGAKFLGKTSNILGITSIGYDFATGTANSSTVVDGLVMVGGSAAIFFGGVALAPWVAGVGVVYGIVSISGGEAWLNRNFDISGYLNFVQPSKP